MGRPTLEWEDTVEMDYERIGWKGVNRIKLAEYKDKGAGPSGRAF